MTDSAGRKLVEEALKLVYGDRHDMYGPAENSFDRIAAGWRVILGIDTISPYQVALCMAWLKIARESYQHKDDNLRDLLGYTLNAADIWEGNDDALDG